MILDFAMLDYAREVDTLNDCRRCLLCRQKKKLCGCEPHLPRVCDETHCMLKHAMRKELHPLLSLLLAITIIIRVGRECTNAAIAE